jgi:hypothetical protein
MYHRKIVHQVGYLPELACYSHGRTFTCSSSMILIIPEIVFVHCPPEDEHIVVRNMKRIKINIS